MNEFTETVNDPKQQEAIKRIERFRNRFTGTHWQFACYAAFPLALTPDLLYRLRDYLLQEEKLQVPWIVVSDLLLSGLCREVDQELYEMDIAVRKELLKRLSKERLQKLSKFLLKYVDRNFQSNITGLKKAQRWTALAYVEPSKAAAELTAMLGKLLLKPNLSQWLQKSSLVETLAEPLREHNFEALLTLAQAMKETALGHYTKATDLFHSLPKTETGEAAIVGGVTVNLPSRPVPAETFSFETVTVNPEGETTKREIDKEAKYFTENLGDSTLEMVYIPRGRFLMGAPETEAESHDDERPQHQVTIKPFLMGKYAVTQAQWKTVANLPQVHRELNPDPSRFKGADRPVECVSWYDAIEFCARLSQDTGKPYRLPSEAEWEYACRAGTTTPFHFGETITTDLANYDGNYTYGSGLKGDYREETTSVGSFGVANAFGLYDMHGNVWEWCADPWHSSYQGAPTDGTVWDETCNDNRYQNNVDLLINTKEDKRTRLLRGGSWFINPRNCRSAFRFNHVAPDYGNDFFGFRVVCVAAWT